MMTQIIIVFGALTLLAGVIIVINPEVIFGYLRGNLDKIGLHIVAVVVRLVLGALLVSQSDLSRYPLAIDVLGWLSIVAALVLAVMGRCTFKRLMSWAFSLLRPYGRVGGIVAMAFGAFIIHAFVM